MPRRGRAGRASRDGDPERVKLTDERHDDRPSGTERVDDVEAQWQREPFIQERDRIALPSWWQGERDPRLLIRYVAVLMGLVLLAALILTVPAIFHTQQPDPADAKAPTAASTGGGSGEADGSASGASATTDASDSTAAATPFYPFGASVLARGDRYGAVAADNAVCSQLGLSVLSELNGNAADAAVTTALCQGVLSPFASGLGGGCFALVRWRNGSADFIDAREVAPAALTEAQLLARGADASRSGALSIGVPGELAGLERLHQRYGSLLWSTVVQPVIPLAHNATVGALLARRLQHNREEVLDSPSMCEVFCDADRQRVLHEGEPLLQPTLAEFLTQVARRGASYLYHDMADTLAQEVRDAGGVLTAEDVRNYTVMHRRPLYSYYRGFEVIGAPPPSAGGAVIGMALNWLEGFGLWRRGHSRQSAQLLAEALKYGFANRPRLGDPAFVPDADAFARQVMLSKYVAARLRSAGDAGRTHEPAYYLQQQQQAALQYLPDDHGTTHISVMDVAGNAVALTSTVNLEFGAKLRSTAAGFVLNDEIDDFAVGNDSNAFGLAPSVANAVAPRKRPLSSMSPTLVVRSGEVVLVVGASGGPRIISSTLQVLLNAIDMGDDVAAAVAYPRLHHQLLPNVLVFEALTDRCRLYKKVDGKAVAAAAVWTEECAYLQRIGHVIGGSGSSAEDNADTQNAVGCAQAVFRPRAGLADWENGQATSASVRRDPGEGRVNATDVGGGGGGGSLYAASDPRKLGVAAAA